jgi:hypothetical protein
MGWAKRHRPALIGFTETPALHWWTPGKAHRKLCEAGFATVWDRWDLHQLEDKGTLKRLCLALIQRNKLIRLFADVIKPDCAFAALKPGRSEVSE